MAMFDSPSPMGLNYNLGNQISQIVAADKARKAALEAAGQNQDNAIKARDEAIQKQRMLALSYGGRQGTILTGARGFTGQPPTFNPPSTPSPLLSLIGGTQNPYKTILGG